MILVVFGNFGGSCCSCHDFFPPPRRGKCCPFLSFCFFSCLAWCLSSFLSVLLFLGSLFGKFFRERTFVFGYRCGSCLFWWCFAYAFALLFGFSCPKMSRENSLLVRSVFLNKFSGANFCLWPPYCHRSRVPFLKGGNAVRFFHSVFWGLVRCLLSSFCRSSLLRVVVRKIFGSELLFLGVGVCCVCFGAVLPMFLLLFWFFSSRNCLKKILLLSGLVFLGCRLSSFGCFAYVVVLVSFFLRETAQVVTGHTPTRTLCSFSFFLSLSPAAFVCSPVLAVRPFLLVFCRSAILGPGRFWILSGLL